MRAEQPAVARGIALEARADREDAGLELHRPAIVRVADGGAAVAVGVALVFLAFVVWWARNRGFDPTDEGLYLLSFRHPHWSEFVSKFYRVVDLLNGPFDPGIVTLRLTRFGALLVSSAFLGLAFHRFVRLRLPHLRGHLPGKWVTASMVGLTGLLGYSWLPAMLSYNDLTATFVATEAAILFGVLGPQDAWTGAARRRTIIGMFILGALLPLHAAVRSSSALAFVFAAVTTSIVVAGPRRSWRLAPRAAAGAATIITVSTQRIIGGSLEVTDFVSALTARQTVTYGPGELLRLYRETSWADISAVFAHHPTRLYALMVVLSGGAIPLFLRGRSRSVAFLSSIAAVAAAAILVTEASQLLRTGTGYFARAEQQEFLLTVLLALAVVVLVVGIVERLGRRRHQPGLPTRSGVAATLFALALPFTAVAGTGNELILAAITAGAGFGCVLVLGLSVVRRAHGTGATRALVFAIPIPVIAGVLTAQAFQGTVIDPYRLSTDLYRQDTAVEAVAPLAGIKLDRESARFFESLSSTLKERTEFRTGDQVLAIAHMPGMVFAIEGIAAAGVVWIQAPTPDFQAKNCLQLAERAQDLRATRVVLQNSEPTPPLRACLAELLPEFPEEFELVARIPNPYRESDSYFPTVSVLVRSSP